MAHRERAPVQVVGAGDGVHPYIDPADRKGAANRVGAAALGKGAEAPIAAEVFIHSRERARSQVVGAAVIL